MSNKIKIKNTKETKVTPEQNAKAIAVKVQKLMKDKFLSRFDEFIEDAEIRALKANGAIEDNEFAKNIVLESDKSDNPKAKSVIESFQTAIDMTKATLERNNNKKEAAIKLRQIIKKEKDVTPLEVITLFDIVMGS